MAIGKQEVEYVAKLARLSLTDEEKERFTRQLDQILGYIQQLNRLDTENIPPTSHVLDLKNVWREDRALPSLPMEDVLANAPQGEGEFFIVPKVIET